MKILHTADWHVGSYKGPEVNGQNARGNDIRRCLSFMVKKAVKENPDLILASGDLFNVAKTWVDRGLSEIITVVETLNKLSKCAPVYVIQGTPNHDGAAQYEFIKKEFASTNVHIMTEPFCVVENTASGPINVCGIPGFDQGIFRSKFPGIAKDQENRMFSQELCKIILALKASCNQEYPSILMGHYTITGANMESGQVAFLTQADPVIPVDVLDSASFDLVAFGHIHRPQRIPGSTAYYCGAIDELNFGDEGQKRGFYIHELSTNEHEFVETPYRVYKTVEMDPDDITNFNSGYLAEIQNKLKSENVENKVVRIRYTCTEEAEKALNKALLEKQVYLAGAFFVDSILMAAPVSTTVASAAFQEKNTPEENVRKYLCEKGIATATANEILDTAKPIIAQVLDARETSKLTGTFQPMAIEVKNYRNYKYQKFDFDPIRFCIVNGEVGAGKSSLFMDAIMDCLYENPREGTAAGWIRNSDDAKSGSIAFTFRIGERIFRVTRTRTKSNKGTLNLAENIKGDWANLSKPKTSETQNEISKIIGMNQNTLLSCAIIMQKCYGLFLEEKPENRMKVFSDILQINMYEEMAASAREKVSETSKQQKILQTKASLLTETIQNEKENKEDLEAFEKDNVRITHEIETETLEFDKLKILYNNSVAAKARCEKLQARHSEMSEKSKTMNRSLTEQNSLLNQNESFLLSEEKIKAGVKHYEALLDQEKKLIAVKSAYEEKKNQLSDDESTMRSSAEKRSRLSKALSEATAEKEKILGIIAEESAFQEKYIQYKQKEKEVAELSNKSEQVIRISDQIAAALNDENKFRIAYKEEVARRLEILKGLERREKLLQEVNCVDIENANCKFLQDAKEAQAQYPKFIEESTEWKQKQQKSNAVLHKKIKDLEAQKNALGYNASDLVNARSLLSRLEKDAKMYETIASYKKQAEQIGKTISTIESELTDLSSTITSKEEIVKKAKADLKQLDVTVEKLRQVHSKMEEESKWLELDKKLPVAKSQIANEKALIQQYTSEIRAIQNELTDLQKEICEEEQKFSEIDSMERQLSSHAAALKKWQDDKQITTLKIGGLTTKLQQQAETKKMITTLRQEIDVLIHENSIYQQIEDMFSADAIPLNIIKSALPSVEQTANGILGQMTGGKMSVSFVTDKIRNKDTQVSTLDIIIEDAEVGRLQYCSKSGGEQVEVALSIILALAELKNKRTGVQLGMLHIDEPPFLSEDGIQAYCDGLELISQKYPDLKVIAISHDPSMKARFPQNVDVVKDSYGSHVFTTGE